MENLLSILDSFQPGWKKQAYVGDLIAILKEMVIPNYSLLETRIEDNKAIFTKEWDQIVSAFREAHIFELLVPPEYGGRKTSEGDIYCLMELLGYTSPGIGIIFVSHGRAIDLVLRGNEDRSKTGNIHRNWSFQNPARRRLAPFFPSSRRNW